MTESSTFTKEMIESAWQEAIHANNAFNQYKLAEMRLQRVREVACFAIRGITIEDSVFTTLERELADAQAEYEYHSVSPGAPAPDSLPRNGKEQVDEPAIARATYAEQGLTVIEQVIGHDDLLVCNKDELYAFAESRGYGKGTATLVYSILIRQGRTVRVKELSDYNPPADTAAKDFGELRTIVYGARQTPKYALDKFGILYTTCKWLDAKPDIKDLGSAVISFLADYCNQIFPELEAEGALPVTHPPKPKGDKEAKAAAESARLRELDPKDLLLDKVNLYGEGEKRVVTDHSLKRHALSLGYTAYNAPKYSRLFHSMVRRMAPGVRPAFHEPHKINDWLVYTGRHSTGTPWGILPDAFRDKIGHFETSPEARQHIDCYSDLTRGVLKQYLEALENVVR